MRLVKRNPSIGELVVRFVASVTIRGCPWLLISRRIPADNLLWECLTVRLGGLRVGLVEEPPQSDLVFREVCRLSDVSGAGGAPAGVADCGAYVDGLADSVSGAGSSD